MIDTERRVLFVGGVPCETTEQVMRICSAAVGGRALALPDGEIGDRSMWIGSLGKLTWAHVPSLETLPADPDIPVAFGGPFRIDKSFTEHSVEGFLPYADAAIDS